MEDTGIGIPDQSLQKIFAPFIQVDDVTTRKFGGTGLGLSLAHSLVEAHDGVLMVESVLGQGSIFTFTLPVRTTAALCSEGRIVGVCLFTAIAVTLKVLRSQSKTARIGNAGSPQKWFPHHPLLFVWMFSFHFRAVCWDRRRPALSGSEILIHCGESLRTRGRLRSWRQQT